MANGIPALLGKVANVTNTVSLISADAAIIAGFFLGPRWGVFNPNGNIALEPDSMVSLEFKKDWKIPNYPVEQGAFQTYNKVRLPHSTRIRMTKGGTEDDRYNFLYQVDYAASSLHLYNILMPEGSLIQSVNITNYSYNRTATNGVGLLSVDIELIQVSVSATAAYQNTAAPSGTDPVSTGSIQPQAPTTSQSAVANQVS